jgi:hypothetical protein
MQHHPQCQRRSTKASTHLLLLSQQLPIAPQKSIAMALVYHLALKPQVPHNLSYLQYESKLFMQSHITGSLLDANASKRERELRIHFIPCLTDLNWTMKNTSRNEREIRLQLPNAAAHPHGEENTSLTTILTCLNACESIQHMKSLSVHRIRIQNHQQVRENCSKTKHERNHKDTEETQNLDLTDCSEA